MPIHKPCLAVSWQDKIYVGHVAVEGLATVGSIQGTPADALLDILCVHGIKHVFKWVDDFIIFHIPIRLEDELSGSFPVFDFDLASLFSITGPLGIPWNPIERKGQDFTSSVRYMVFPWDLELHRVSLPDKKCIKLLSKIQSFLSLSSSPITHHACVSLHGSLQHITFIYREGRSALPPLSSFSSKFLNKFSQCHMPASVLESLCW